MVMPICDQDGNPLLVVTANVFCPAAHIAEARDIASLFQRDVSRVVDWQPEKMLPIALSQTGSEPATHFLCSMECFDSDAAAMVEWIANTGNEWCAQSLLSVSGDLTTKFGVCCSTKEEFLEAAGLQVIA